MGEEVKDRLMELTILYDHKMETHEYACCGGVCGGVARGGVCVGGGGHGGLCDVVEWCHDGFLGCCEGLPWVVVGFVG